MIVCCGSFPCVKTLHFAPIRHPSVISTPGPTYDFIPKILLSPTFVAQQTKIVVIKINFSKASNQSQFQKDYHFQYT